MVALLGAVATTVLSSPIAYYAYSKVEQEKTVLELAKTKLETRLTQQRNELVELYERISELEGAKGNCEGQLKQQHKLVEHIGHDRDAALTKVVALETRELESAKRERENVSRALTIAQRGVDVTKQMVAHNTEAIRQLTAENSRSHAALAQLARSLRAQAAENEATMASLLKELEEQRQGLGGMIPAVAVAPATPHAR